MNAAMSVVDQFDSLIESLVESVLTDPEQEIHTDATFIGEDIAGSASVLRTRTMSLLIESDRRGRMPFDDTMFARGGWALTPVASAKKTRSSQTDANDQTGRRIEDFPRSIGRYSVLRRLGGGGMGEVFLTYDETLDRKLAVKLLRPRRAQKRSLQKRLIREAQAMARISHPNVAPVYEIGEAGEQTFVAMEYIRGRTLRRWLREQPRSWREVVDVFVQAARGLAAAHRLGLVHRDFKPSNVMLGDDGRARVLDFGLVALHDEDERTTDGNVEERDSRPASMADELTRMGELMGTPHYMSPEQYLGVPPKPAADQFAFCVALYEALYGERPYHGDTYTELINNVICGRRRPLPSNKKVPQWLSETVIRGLSSQPEKRYATMEALIVALSQDPSRRHRRLATGLLLVGVAGGSGYGASVAMADEAPCEGVERALDGVWDERRRMEVERGLALANADIGAELSERVVNALDVYSDAWIDGRRDACLDHERGENSDELLARRMACLDRRLAAIDTVTDVLADADEGVAARALDVTSGLLAVSSCENVDYVNAAYPAPASPEAAREVGELHRRLSRAAALERAGELGRARIASLAVGERAAAIGDQALEAEAYLSAGRILIGLAELEPERVYADLDRAVSAAVAADVPDLAADAIARRMYVYAVDGRGAGALRDLPVALAFIERSVEVRRLEGLVYDRVGSIHTILGDKHRAREAYSHALQARVDALGSTHPEVGFTTLNLALLADGAARLDGIASALELLEQGLGSYHPRTIDIRLGLSMHTNSPDEAVALRTSTSSGV